MANTLTTYYAGGFKPASPAFNRASEYDLDASTFTTWALDGTQTAQRAMTPAELADLLPASNRSVLLNKAQSALTTNATFLALAAPTNAQTLAQVQTLTKECNALIRLALNILDSTTGT